MQQHKFGARLTSRMAALGLVMGFGAGCALLPPPAEHQAKSAHCPAETAAANEVLDAFMAGFNARDMSAWEATYHFPHFRVAGGRLSILDKPGEQPADLFDRLGAAGWARSAWKDRTVVQCGPDKVHVAVAFERYRADGSLLEAFPSLYVVAKIDGRWGVQGRSSFAP